MGAYRSPLEHLDGAALGHAPNALPASAAREYLWRHVESSSLRIRRTLREPGPSRDRSLPSHRGAMRGTRRHPKGAGNRRACACSLLLAICLTGATRRWAARGRGDLHGSADARKLLKLAGTADDAITCAQSSEVRG